jgi:hypothetical protein
MRQTIDAWYREKIKDVNKMILHESEEQILGTTLEEMCSYYYDQFKITPITLLKESMGSEYEKGVETIPAEQRDSLYSQDGDLDYPYEKIVVTIPIKDNEDTIDISKYQSSPGFVNRLEDNYMWSPNKISFSIKTQGYMLKLTEEQINKRIEKSIEELEKLLEYKNSNIRIQNKNLEETIKKSLEKRREAIEESNNRFESIKRTITIPLTLKDSVKRDIINLKEKPIVKKVKPSPQKQTEFSLDEKQVLHLISYIDNQARSFERTPGTFSELGEEQLRDILLSNINGLFGGKATGETFSKKGKTDIFLNIKKGNILIIECKFWKGEEVFNETIDQIRRYLTWRENSAVIIFFVKRKNFIKILNKIPAIIQKHASFDSGYRELEVAHFVSNNIIDDSGKNVKVHYLFYNLYTEQP